MSLCINFKNLENLLKNWGKLTINESVRSGMPVSLTQASITPWISAVMVEPEWKQRSNKRLHVISASTARRGG